jgi:uncharacterized protein with PIN domain
MEIYQTIRRKNMFMLGFRCPDCDEWCDAVVNNSNAVEWHIDEWEDQEMRCSKCGTRYIISKPEYYTSGHDYID